MCRLVSVKQNMMRQTLEKSGVVDVPVGRYCAAEHHTHRNPWPGGPRSMAQIARKPEGKTLTGPEPGGRGPEGCGSQQDSRLRSSEDQTSTVTRPTTAASAGCCQIGRGHRGWRSWRIST